MTKQTNETTPVPVLVSWSSGKDSAWALHTLRQQSEHYDVRGIFTTVTKTFDRVSIHSTPAWVLKQQAEKLGVPLYEIPIPYPCSNAIYEEAMRKFLAEVEALPEGLGASHFAFGDLFLEDIREYREDKLKGTGFTPIFPVWGEDTTLLAEKMIASGMRAIITALNPTKVPADFAGRWFDAAISLRTCQMAWTHSVKTGNSIRASLMDRCSVHLSLRNRVKSFRETSFLLRIKMTKFIQAATLHRPMSMLM